MKSKSKLKNRIVMLPMHLRLEPARAQARTFYRARAKGGVAAIISWAGTAMDLPFEESLCKTNPEAGSSV